MRGLQVWSEGRKRRVGAGLKGLPWVARGGKHGKGAAAAAAAAAPFLGGALLPLSAVLAFLAAHDSATP